MNAILFPGAGLVKRVQVPRCPKCAHNGRVSRDCGYCDGSGYYESCDCCNRDLTNPSSTLYRVDRPGLTPFYSCDRAECAAIVFEELATAMREESEAA